MGQLDQYAKQMFAEETERATGGAVRWQEPVEINLTEVRLDGMLLVRDASRLGHLDAPWSEAGGVDEIVIEVKMQGDHLGMPAVQRGLLRRQARQVQRGEDASAPWDDEQALWFVASHLPKILATKRTVERVAPGCYRVGPGPFPFVWVVANELPLLDELLPFLIVRSGRPLDEFCRWAATRKPLDWVTRMLEFLPMSIGVYDEINGWLSAKSYEPFMDERRRNNARRMLALAPEIREEVATEVRIVEARDGLHRVLAKRKLVASGEDEARIAACVDLATLHRWHDQAIDAPSAAEALK